MVKTLANFKEVSKSNKNVKLTWFETKIWTGPASAKNPICKNRSIFRYFLQHSNPQEVENMIPEKLAGKRETYTLFTMVTTASRISPLNGLNTTHWYLTGNVTNPVPSRINPFPMFSMPVIATTNPCRPLQECREFFL
jgi:hypothetical protein